MTVFQISTKLADVCKSTEGIHLSAALPEEFLYNSLDLCVIDAVFSIGVKYGSVKTVVARYKNYIENTYPSLNERSRTVSESISIFESYQSIQEFAKNILNQQRTSTRNGILKAEAVLEILKVLEKHGIETIECFRNMDPVEQNALDTAILSVRGQGSGIMLKYLYMLAGNDNICKPDRMLHRFVASISGRKMSDDELQLVLAEACEILKKEFPSLTVRILDNQIWQYQRSHSSAR